MIEDNDYSRIMVAGFLEESGVANVLEASDGSEALEILAEGTVGLIICDIIMEPMDG